MSDTAQPQKTHWFEVVLLWVSGIAAAMQFAKFSISYDELLTHYQAGPAWTGALISVVGIVGLIFGASAGVVAGRMGYLNVLVGALAIGSLLSVLESFLPSFMTMLVLRVLEGMSQLGVVVAAPTMIARLSAPQHRSITMGLWGTFFGVAFAITGWLGNKLLSTYGLQGLLLVHGVLIGSMALALWWLLSQYKSVYENQSAPSSLGFWTQLRNMYKTPRTLLPALVFLFYTCMLVSLLTYIPTLISDEKLRNLLRITLPLTSTAGTFLAGALSQYVMRPQRVALLAFSSVAVGAVFAHFSQSYPIVFALSVSLMVLSAGMVPGSALSMIPLVTRSAGEQAQGYGLIAQLGNLGATIGPPSFAAMIALMNTEGLVLLVLFLCVLGGLFSFLAGRLPSNPR
ncbi:Inner membrane transport protein YajR [Marinomonas spartinae]|uniref:MFS transporter n=1 Tax=Marinomonas spartinae TaxID=1792290 RepID=UPI000808A270|nr:MFS transporter [Marinomonas spartinae]SBS39990.1 Inner membrane transport protein YajR [Marinomonas spartinae]